eukprot:902025-Pleurochrysis_carterae.AAC.1
MAYLGSRHACHACDVSTAGFILVVSPARGRRCGDGFAVPLGPDELPLASVHQCNPELWGHSCRRMPGLSQALFTPSQACKPVDALHSSRTRD